MAAASTYFTRVSSCCLLPLQETPQDQHAGLTQTSFKLLLLPWVQKSVRFCVRPLGVESLFSQPSGSPKSKPCWPSKPNDLGAHFPGAGPLGWGAQCGDQTLHSFGKTSAIVIILLFIGLDYTMTPPLLPLWFLIYTFSCRRSFLVDFSISHQ